MYRRSKRDIAADIREAEENLESLKLELRLADGRNRVPDGDRYFYVDDSGDVEEDSDDGLDVDTSRFEMGNYFYSRHEATVNYKRKKALTRVIDRINALNAKYEWSADWQNDTQKKYTVTYNYSRGLFEPVYYYGVMVSPVEFHGCQLTIEEVIEEHSSDLYTVLLNEEMSK